MSETRTYIKIWLWVALIVNLVAFSALQIDADKIIKCNRTYNLVYPCNTNPVVYSAIPDGDPGNIVPISDDVDFETANREPSLEEGKQTTSDLDIIIEMLLYINLAMVGIAFILYFIVATLENRQMWRSSSLSLVLIVYIFGAGYGWYRVFKYVGEPGEIREVHYNAPIIYLYDEQEREANVKLDLNGELTCTYPKYDESNGWTVKTSADGVLTDNNGRQYEYLYWEADVDMEPDFSNGFCVRGEDSAVFLEKALSDLGLSDTEANAFIMYWLPDLEENPYNVIAFQTDTYEEVAKLNVDPLPDTVVRVNMLFYGSDEYVEIQAQELSAMNPSLEEREGFVLVEWGGGKLG